MPQAALVSPQDPGTIMALVEIQPEAVGFKELNGAFVQTPEVLMGVPEYSQPIWEVQMVWNLLQQIINLLRQILDIQA
jgi:hypothetical protein